MISGGDTFTGIATISGSTLELSSAAAAGTGSITFAPVSSGASETLRIDGTTMPTNVISESHPEI